jgi:hypothetical protein
MIKIVFLLLLAACTSIPTTPDGPQCSPVFSYVNSTDGKEFIDVEGSYCLCREYHFGLDYVGKTPDSTTWKEPIKYCDRLIGWTPKEYAKKATFWEAVRAKIEQESGGND